MSQLARDVTRMFCIGFDGSAVAPEARELIAGGAGGVILFSRNVRSPEQLAQLAREVKALRSAGRPVLTMIDQEGGRVARLREGFTLLPSMREIGRTGRADLARRAGRVLSAELRAVNIDVDLAPVLDVDTNPANPVIGERSFGSSPQLVAEMGCALIDGLQSGGVAACGKHFPGHGDTSQDSHLDLPRLPHAMQRLEAVELPPFAAAVRAGVACIMTAHVIFEPLDPRPATMSHAVLDGILRKKMGFDGVIISDDLEMKAIAEHFGIEEAVTLGALAGVDLFLACHRAEVQHAAIEALVKAVERGTVPRERITESNRRLDALCARYCKPGREVDQAVLGCAEHRAVAEEILRAV